MNSKDCNPISKFVDYVHSQVPDAGITTNFFRTNASRPLVMVFYSGESLKPRTYHAFWTEDGRTYGHVVLGDSQQRDRFIRNCYERDAVTTVPSDAYASLTTENHLEARDRAIEILKAWE